MFLPSTLSREAPSHKVFTISASWPCTVYPSSATFQPSVRPRWLPRCCPRTGPTWAPFSRRAVTPRATFANVLSIPAINTFACRHFVGAGASVVEKTPFLRYMSLFVENHILSRKISTRSKLKPCSRHLMRANGGARSSCALPLRARPCSAALAITSQGRHKVRPARPCRTTDDRHRGRRRLAASADALLGGATRARGLPPR